MQYNLQFWYGVFTLCVGLQISALLFHQVSISLCHSQLISIRFFTNTQPFLWLLGNLIVRPPSYINIFFSIFADIGLIVYFNKCLFCVGLATIVLSAFRLPLFQLECFLELVFSQFHIHLLNKICCTKRSFSHMPIITKFQIL